MAIPLFIFGKKFSLELEAYQIDNFTVIIILQ